MGFVFTNFQELTHQEFELTPTQPLTLVGYRSNRQITAYIEPVAVGEKLPDMPLFLTPQSHVLVPLETTYQATWDACPAAIRKLLEAP